MNVDKLESQTGVLQKGDLCLQFFNDLQCQRPSAVPKDISDNRDLQEAYNRNQVQLFLLKKSHTLQFLNYQDLQESARATACNIAEGLQF